MNEVLFVFKGKVKDLCAAVKKEMEIVSHANKKAVPFSSRIIRSE